MARDRKRMTEEELSALCDAEVRDAVGYDRTELSNDRQRAIEYYRGEMADTPAEDGRSSVVSHDVADTIGWILPSLMRVFFTSDRIVEFQPETEADKEFAKQASDYVNFVFLRECHGYQVMWDAWHDALLVRNGIVKVYWDSTPEYRTFDFSGLSEEALQFLASQDDVEILQQGSEARTEESVDPETGQPVSTEVMVYEGKARRERTSGRLVFEAVPPEEFLIEKRATDLDDALFLAHRRRLPRADLVAMGFDKETVLTIPTYSELEHSEEVLARWENDDAPGHARVLDVMREEVEIFECFVKVDYDGDGQLECRRVIIGGNSGGRTVLLNEEYDEHPFVDFVPERIPHRWQGRCPADDTMDIQRIKTVLLRQMLDNLYLQNRPQRWVDESRIKNPDEVINPTLGGVVRVDGDPNTASRTEVIPFVAANVFQAVEYMDMMAEKRTGVSRATMGLDPDAVNNQTATASNNMQAAAYSKIELIARNFAEMGLPRLFRKALKLIVRHQDKPRIIRLRDEFVPMDPRHWDADMDCEVQVGLGSGSRDRDLAAMGQIGLEQDKVIAQLGPVPAYIEAWRSTRIKMAELAGIKNPEQFFPEIDPASLSGQESDPKADAEMAKVNAEIEANKAKLTADVELKRVQAQADIEMRRERNAAELQAMREKNAMDMQLARERAAMDAEIRREELRAEIMLKQRAVEMGVARGSNVARPE